MDLATKRSLVDSHCADLSLEKQCSLLNLNRSSYYYTPRSESDFNLDLMRLIDRQYLETPFYGVERMTAWLKNSGFDVNVKRIRRLMRLMNLVAVGPKPNLSRPDLTHKKYPYLLENQSITAINQVWSTDITYIPMPRGFLYLTAVIDWYSRYVLSWGLSNTLETGFCLTALQTALNTGKPAIFNTDQGVQYTSRVFTDFLESQEIRISMDGKGRATDNAKIERLWRSVKYECVYLNAFETGEQLFQGLKKYFEFYNCQRIHQSLDYQTPESVHFFDLNPTECNPEFAGG